MKSNFIKYAEDQNRIKPLKDAFKDYPVEEEWHRGRPDFFIEESEEKEEYDVNDIVFVNEYYYPDHSIGKNHLFVIIDKNKAIRIDYFGMLLSSKLAKLSYSSNVKLFSNNKNNLKKDSIVKKDEIYTISKENILFKIGSVSAEKVELYKKCFYENTKKEDG